MKTKSKQMDIWQNCGNKIKKPENQCNKICYPLPSISYNPDPENHKLLIESAKKIIASENRKFNRISKKSQKALKSRTKTNLLTRGDQFIDDVDANTGSVSEDEADIVIKEMPNRYKKKSKKQRRDDTLHKLNIVLQNEKICKKRIRKDINNIHEIKKKIRAEMLTRVALKNEKIAKKLEKQRPTLDIDDIPISETLTGSLSRIKPLGSYISDKFKSLYKDKMLVGGPANKCKPKSKIIEKKRTKSGRWK